MNTLSPKGIGAACSGYDVRLETAQPPHTYDIWTRRCFRVRHISCMPGRKKLHSALGYHLPSAEPRPRGDRASWYPWVCDGVLGKDVPSYLYARLCFCAFARQCQHARGVHVFLKLCFVERELERRLNLRFFRKSLRSYA